MKHKPILIICGEPNSIFSEIIVKTFRKYKNKKPIILIGSYDLLCGQIKKIRINQNLNVITFSNKKFHNLKKNKLNILNVNFRFKKVFEKISSKSNIYIANCFEKAFEIIKSIKISGLINGPISKKYFLKNKHLGITEYLSKKFNIKSNYSMLIYNKDLSVSPITTHLPISKVTKHLSKNLIVSKILLIDNFYKLKLNKKPKIAITGLNPHCENFFNKSEEEMIIQPAINYLKKKKNQYFWTISRRYHLFKAKF